MALPAGASGCVVTFGPFTDFSGTPLRGEVIFLASTSLIWSTTGQPLFKTPKSVKLIDGWGSIELAHVDQEGFVDGVRGVVTLWSYRAIVRFKDAPELNPLPFSFQVFIGQDTMDIDQLLPITGTSGGTVVPGLTVTSVNGQAGAVTVPSTAQLNSEIATRENNVNDLTATLTTHQASLEATQGDLERVKAQLHQLAGGVNLALQSERAALEAAA